jgi:hypothetical protein
MSEQPGGGASEQRLAYFNRGSELVWQRNRAGWMNLSLTPTTHVIFRARHAPACDAP